MFVSTNQAAWSSVSLGDYKMLGPQTSRLFHDMLDTKFVWDDSSRAWLQRHPKPQTLAISNYIHWTSNPKPQTKFKLYTSHLSVVTNFVANICSGDFSELVDKTFDVKICLGWVFQIMIAKTSQTSTPNTLKLRTVSIKPQTPNPVEIGSMFIEFTSSNKIYPIWM